jgi:hypothetical protein
VQQRAKERRLAGRHRDRDPGAVRFTAALGSTDDGWTRRITQHLPATYAARSFDAQAAGAAEQQFQ